MHAILLEPSVWTLALAVVGAVLMVWGLVALRRDIGALLHRRRTEIALYALGMVGVLMVVAYLSVLYPLRYDLTDEGLHSLSEQTVAMLERLENPVHIVLFPRSPAAPDGRAVRADRRSNASGDGGFL